MYTTRLCFSVSTRLPHYSLIFDSEFIGILLALQKASANILKVNTLADTPFVLASLGNGGTGRDYAQHLYDLISSHIQKFQLSRVPGHVGIRQNECLSAVNSWHMVTATSHSLCLNWGSRFKFLIFFHSVETLGVSITAPSAVPYISLYWTPKGFLAGSRSLSLFQNASLPQFIRRLDWSPYLFVFINIGSLVNPLIGSRQFCMCKKNNKNIGEQFGITSKLVLFCGCRISPASRRWISGPNALGANTFPGLYDRALPRPCGFFFLPVCVCAFSIKA